MERLLVVPESTLRSVMQVLRETTGVPAGRIHDLLTVLESAPALQMPEEGERRQRAMSVPPPPTEGDFTGE